MGRIGVGIDFATSGRVVVAIGKTWSAHNPAGAVVARGRSVGARTRCSAAVAVVDVRIQIHFAAVGRVVVAVGKASVARAHLARAALAAGRGIVERALVAADAAIVNVGLQIDFTTIGGRLVTVIKPRGTSAKRARAALTAGRGVVEGTLVAATAAVVHVVRCVGAARRAIGACGIPCGAVAVSARGGRTRADGRTPRCVTLGAATAAVVHIGIEVSFTAIGSGVVTI